MKAGELTVVAGGRDADARWADAAVVVRCSRRANVVPVLAGLGLLVVAVLPYVASLVLRLWVTR